jgi:hypothetical protein
MSDLLTSILARVPNAVTNASPAVATIAFAGSPSYLMAFKGQKSTDQIYFAGAGALDGPVKNTLTDAKPALAAIDVYLTQALVLAWKVAGQQTVQVMQYPLGEDGFPVSGGPWAPLTTTGGRPANPTVQTDTAPALAVGANSQIYLAWKTPGPSGTVKWSVYDGKGWSRPATIPQAVTGHAPALAGFNTSGPGNVWPLCLAWKQANGYNLFWSSFAPGAASLSVNQVPGVATDAAPALTQGPVGKAYYLAWKDQGAETISFAPVKGKTTGVVLTLPQAKSSYGPGIANYSNNTSGFGAQVFDTLIVAFAGLTSRDVWQGQWAVVSSPVTAPSGGLKGNSNYFLASGTDCAVLTGVEVTITITERLAYSNGYSFQLNCNSPTNAPNYQRCNWQQCGWQVDSTGQLQFWINNYTVSEGNSINTPYNKHYTIKKLRSTTLPKGYVLTITLDFDRANNNLIGTTFGATDETGHAFPSKYVGYVGLPLATNNAAANAKVTDQYLAPISALQLTIDGFDNLEFATFTSGAAVVSFKAHQKLTAQPSIPRCADQTTTGENSNILYGAIPSAADKTQSQLVALA